MGKTSDMAARLANKYNQTVPTAATHQEPETVPSPELRKAAAPGRHRGRPKGSITRKEEVQFVGFEADVKLLEAFDAKAQGKGITRREAFQEALRCFIQN